MTDLDRDLQVAQERMEREARKTIATHLKIVHRQVGRAQTIATALGHHKLGQNLTELRGHLGRIQMEFDVDGDWAVNDTAVRQLEETLISATRAVANVQRAKHQASVAAELGAA